MKMVRLTAAVAEELVRTGGERAFEDEFGQSMFEYIQANPEHAEVFDSHMLLLTGGRLRTVAEFQDLFQQSGLEFVGHHTAADAAMSVVEGRVA